MAFESLTDKLQNVFKGLRKKGRLTEEDVKKALKEVKMALLEADVSFRVVKQFMKSVEERAVGEEVLNGLNPGQMVIKIVNEEMIALMGSETTEIALQPGKAITVIMMCGLQGSGKTTFSGKLANLIRSKRGRGVLLVACDVYRPAAIEQLKVLGGQIGVEVYFEVEKLYISNPKAVKMLTMFTVFSVKTHSVLTMLTLLTLRSTTLIPTQSMMKLIRV